jgi:hypothetical protein
MLSKYYSTILFLPFIWQDVDCVGCRFYQEAYHAAASAAVILRLRSRPCSQNPQLFSGVFSFPVHDYKNPFIRFQALAKKVEIR